jgi:hypothetical protein
MGPTQKFGKKKKRVSLAGEKRRGKEKKGGFCARQTEGRRRERKRERSRRRER